MSFKSPNPIDLSIPQYIEVNDGNGTIINQTLPNKTFECISKKIENWDSSSCKTLVLKNKIGFPEGVKCSCPSNEPVSAIEVKINFF